MPQPKKSDRLMAEADRIAQIKANAARPFGVGPEIVDIAPARGPVRRFQPRETVITPSGTVRVTRAGHRGFDAIQIADAFDLMQAQASKRNKDAPPLFTVGQVNAARDFAALYERCATAGVRCSSMESLGGSGDGSFIDAVMRDSRRLDALQRAIGTDVVLSPRGAAAHADRGRRVMRADDLVLGVCVGDLTISQMLQKFGWSRAGKNLSKTRQALADALDRMQGFRDQDR